MLRETKIVPAILTDNKLDYRKQVETINGFTNRVQVDITDGAFAPTTTLDVSNLWWPKSWQVDIHMMVAYPSRYLETILKLHPYTCIFHAEASENLLPAFEQLQAAGIHTGVALLPATYPGFVEPYIAAADHVLIFAGTLGVQGSKADMMQMEKIGIVREMKAEAEIGWDGGANLSNIRALAHADLDVINVGSALSQSPNPVETYAAMVAEIDKNGVLL